LEKVQKSSEGNFAAFAFSIFPPAQVLLSARPNEGFVHARKQEEVVS
jgi:hypothetical protein